MATQHRKRKAAAQTGIYLAVIAAIAVVANILTASGLYTRVDTTRTERYTLSDGSGRLVQSLDGPVQVDVYVTRGLPRLDTFVRDLTNLLKEYHRAAPEKFEFTLIEANTDELREQAKEAGLSEMAFGQTSATREDQASIAQGFMGLVFKYGSEKEVIPQLHPSQKMGLEFRITNKIREIRDKADEIEHRVGIVTGKDELKLSDPNLVPRQGKGGSPSIKQILEQSFPFYTFEDVELSGGNEEIDPELEGLIITQPRKDYTDKELKRIDQFVMRGEKSLAVYASAVTMKPQDPSMQAKLNLHNLDKLLLGYGVDLKKNAVLDFGAQFRVPVMTQTGQVQAIRHPGIAHVVHRPGAEDAEQVLDNSFAGFFRMEEAAFPFPSSIEVLPKKQPEGVQYNIVARSTPQASVVEDGPVDMSLRPDWQPQPPMAQRNIAVTVEGKLNSAMGGDEEIQINEQAPKPSRVLVVASGLFLTNPFAYAGNGQKMGGQMAMMGAVGGDRKLQMIAQPYAQRYLTNTILSVKNTLDWMTGETDLLEASAKILGEPNLTYASLDKPELDPEMSEEDMAQLDEEFSEQRQELQQQVQWTLTLGMPALFALFGIGRWRWRETKKNQRKV